VHNLAVLQAGCARARGERGRVREPVGLDGAAGALEGLESGVGLGVPGVGVDEEVEGDGVVAGHSVEQAARGEGAAEAAAVGGQERVAEEERRGRVRARCGRARRLSGAASSRSGGGGGSTRPWTGTAAAPWRGIVQERR
jgi:hypothetical protein